MPVPQTLINTGLALTSAGLTLGYHNNSADFIDDPQDQTSLQQRQFNTGIGAVTTAGVLAGTMFAAARGKNPALTAIGMAISAGGAYATGRIYKQQQIQSMDENNSQPSVGSKLLDSAVQLGALYYGGRAIAPYIARSVSRMDMEARPWFKAMGNTIEQTKFGNIGNFSSAFDENLQKSRELFNTADKRYPLQNHLNMIHQVQRDISNYELRGNATDSIINRLMKKYTVSNNTITNGMRQATLEDAVRAGQAVQYGQLIRRNIPLNKVGLGKGVFFDTRSQKIINLHKYTPENVLAGVTKAVANNLKIPILGFNPISVLRPNELIEAARAKNTFHIFPEGTPLGFNLKAGKRGAAYIGGDLFDINSGKKLTSGLIVKTGTLQEEVINGTTKNVFRETQAGEILRKRYQVGMNRATEEGFEHLGNRVIKEPRGRFQKFMTNTLEMDIPFIHATGRAEYSSTWDKLWSAVRGREGGKSSLEAIKDAMRTVFNPDSLVEHKSNFSAFPLKEIKYGNKVVKVGHGFVAHSDLPGTLAFWQAHRPVRLFESLGIGGFNPKTSRTAGDMMWKMVMKRALPLYLSYKMIQFTNDMSHKFLGYGPLDIPADALAGFNVGAAYMRHALNIDGLANYIEQLMPGSISGAGPSLVRGLGMPLLAGAKFGPKGLAVGGAISALLGGPSGQILKSPKDIQDEYFGNKRVGIRGGRWWEMGCQIYDDNIFIDTGFKKVQDITLNDNIIGIDGTPHKIDKIYKYDYSGDVYKIAVNGWPDTTTVTPNHPYLLSSGEYMWAQNLEIGDEICIPLPPKLNSWIISINLNAGLSQTIIKDNKLYNTQSQQGKYIRSSGKPINSTLLLNEEVGEIFGYFLAEGNINRSKDRIQGIEFVCAKNELNYITRISSLITKYFGVTGSIKLGNGNYYRLRISSSILGKVFDKLFINNEGKTLTSLLVHNTSDDFLKGIMKAWFFGDGHISKDKISIKTSKKSLAIIIRQLLLRLGLYPSVTKGSSRVHYKKLKEIRDYEYYLISLNLSEIEDAEKIGLTFAKANKLSPRKKVNNLSHSKPNYTKTDKYVITKIKSIDIIDYSGPVFDIQVPDGHAFLTDTGITHNSGPFEGGKVKYYVPNWYRRMKSRYQYTDTQYGSEGEYWSNIMNPYHYAIKHYKDRPYPLATSGFEEFPFVGQLLGGLIAPPMKMHQDEMNALSGSNSPSSGPIAGGFGSVGGAFPQPLSQGLGGGLGKGTPEQAGAYGVSSTLGGLPKQPAGSPLDVKGRLGSEIYQMNEYLGMYGFLANSLKANLTGNQNVFTQPQLESSERIGSAERNYWERNLGGLFENTELFRRFLPHRRHDIDYQNPLKNQMPDWMPGSEYFQNFKIGDPYAKSEYGEFRLPGEAYKKFNTPGAGIQKAAVEMGKSNLAINDGYSPLDQYKVLSDVAPYSNQAKYASQYIMALSKAGGLTPEAEEERKAIRRETSTRKKAYRFSARKFTEGALQNESVTVNQYLGKGRFSVKGQKDVYTLAGLKGITPEGDQYLGSIIKPGENITVQTLADKRYRRKTSTSIPSVPVLVGPLNRNLINKGFAEYNKTGPADVYDPLNMRVRYNPVERTMGAIWENIAHIDTPFHSKFLNQKTALEQYRKDMVYDTQQADWQHPISSFVMPFIYKGRAASPIVATLAGAAMSLFGTNKVTRVGLGVAGALTGLALSLTGGEDYIPGYRKKERDVDQYFDILNYLKNKRLYEYSRKKAIEEEGIDPEKLEQSIEASQTARRAINKALKAKYSDAALDELYDKSLDRSDKEVKRAIRDKHNIAEGIKFMQNQKATEDEVMREAQGGFTGAALEFRKRYKSTAYGADVHGDFASIMRALPTKEREFFSAFVTAPKEDRKKIKKIAPLGMRRFLEAKWGEDVEDNPDLETYFKDHKLPNDSWIGWHPAVNLNDVKLKVVQQQGLEKHDFNMWDSQVRDLQRKPYVPLIDPFSSKGNHHNIKQEIQDIVTSQGYNNYSVDVQAYSGNPNNSIDIDVKYATNTQARDYIKSHMRDLVSPAYAN